MCSFKAYRYQWRNRRGGGAAGTGRQGRVPPDTSNREISADLPGKKEARKRGKGMKIVKEDVGNWKRKVEKIQNEERSFFFFFFFFFCLSLFKNTKIICFGSTKWKFSTRKKHFTPGKKSGKVTLPPQKNFAVTPLCVTRDRPTYHNQYI